MQFQSLISEKTIKSRQKIHKAKHQPQQQEAGAFSRPCVVKCELTAVCDTMSGSSFEDITFLKSSSAAL